MTASVWHLRTAQKVVLALIGIMGTLDSASAMPLKREGLSAAECYRADSGCTQFCGEVTNPDYRYPCFAICDRMLDRCLGTGEWTDSGLQIDPGTGKPLDKTDLLLGQFVRQLMTLGNTDEDGVLTPPEIQSLKEKIREGVDANGGPKTPAPRD